MRKLRDPRPGEHDSDTYRILWNELQQWEVPRAFTEQHVCALMDALEQVPFIQMLRELQRERDRAIGALGLLTYDAVISSGRMRELMDMDIYKQREELNRILNDDKALQEAYPDKPACGN